MPAEKTTGGLAQSGNTMHAAFAKFFERDMPKIRESYLAWSSRPMRVSNDGAEPHTTPTNES